MLQTIFDKYGDTPFIRYHNKAVKEMVAAFPLVAALDSITGEHLPEFNKIQKEFLSDNRRFTIFRAARRVGKSYTGAAKILPYVLAPHTRGAVIGPDYDKAKNEFQYILDFLRAWIKREGLDPLVTVRNNPKQGDLYIKTAWGAEIFGKSAKEPESLVGEAWDWLILAECATLREDVWGTNLRPALTTRKGIAVFPSTPAEGGQWLYELEEKAYDNPEVWGVHHCTMAESGHIPKDEIEQLKRDLPEAAFEEQCEGQWRMYSGRVHRFDRNIHLVKLFTVPKGWPIYAGLDFGGTRDKTAMAWFAKSPFGDFYCIGTYYKNNLTTRKHVENVKAIEAGLPGAVTKRVSDYHALGVQLMKDWNDFGIKSSPTANVGRASVRDNFSSMLELKNDVHPFHIREAGLPKGEYPRLFFFEGKCDDFVKEMMFLRWKDGNPKQGGSNDVVGEDHLIAAGEYIMYDQRITENRGRFRRTVAKVANWGAFV